MAEFGKQGITYTLMENPENPRTIMKWLFFFCPNKAVDILKHNLPSAYDELEIPTVDLE